MKVYFNASVSRYRKLLPVYQSTVQSIELLGHEVTSKHVVDPKETQGDWEKNYEPHQLFQREVHRLQMSQVLISDVTVPSWGASFMIEESIRQQKPRLSLYYGEFVEQIPLMLRGHPYLNLHLYTEDNIDAVLRLFFQSLSEVHPAKFTVKPSNTYLFHEKRVMKIVT